MPNYGDSPYWVIVDVGRVWNLRGGKWGRGVRVCWVAFWKEVLVYCMYCILLCTVLYCVLGWSVDFFFDQTEHVNYPKVRHDFKSPNPKFRSAPVHACQSFNFQKIPWGLNINIFL